MKSAVILAATAANINPNLIRKAAISAGVEPDAAAAAVWLAIADPCHDIDGTPLLPIQHLARDRNLAQWAARRVAALGDVPAGLGSGGLPYEPTDALDIGETYAPPRTRTMAWNDGTVSQRTARRWQARRRRALEAGQALFRGPDWGLSGNAGEAA